LKKTSDVQIDQHSRETVSSALSLWRRMWQTRIVVIILMGTSLVDVTVTILLVNRIGKVGEFNPFIRWIFELNLTIVWMFVSVTASFLCGAVLSWVYIHLKGRTRSATAALLSTVVAARVSNNFYGVTTYWNLEKTQILLIPLCLFAFVLTWQVLHGIRSNEESTWPQISLKTPTQKKGRWLITKALVALILVPLMTFTFLQALVIASGVQNMPRWLRSLGVVTELQGRLFLVGLIAIVIMVGGMVYGIATLFEILSREDKIEKHNEQRVTLGSNG